MGRRYSALYGVIAAALMLFCGALSAQNNIGMHAKIRSFTMPQYHEESNRLQFIVYGKKADNKGALLYLEDLVIDFMQNGLTDVGKVRMMLRPEARRQAMSGSGEKTYKSAAEYFEQDLKQEQKSNKTKE